MKKQKGAALIVVLSLLVVALMVGLSSMQSSHIDERLAGNYRAQSLAQMGAEKAAAVGWGNFNNNDSWEKLSDLTSSDLASLSWAELEGDDDLCESPVSCYYRYVEDGNGKYIVSIGRVGDDASLSESIFIKVDVGGPSPLFNSPIVGCEGVVMAGGSTIGSYDSREGPWDGTVGGFSATDAPLVSTLNGGDSNIVLGDNEKIHGSISSYGGVSLDGSSTVHGNITANKLISFPANSVVMGGVETLGDIGFSGSGRVESSLKSGGDIVFGNWSSYVGEAIYAGGEVVTNTSRNDPSEHLPVENRGNYFPGNSGNPVGVAQQSCDNATFGERNLVDERDNLKSVVTSIDNDPDIANNDLAIGPWPNENWELNSEGLRRFDKSWNINDWVSHGQTQAVENALGRDGEVSVMRVGDLSISQSGRLRVSGDVLLVVEGDFNISGGGQGLIIDPGSSLTVVVEGMTQFGSAARMDSVNSINSNGDPSFSLFSTYGEGGTGVEFNGGGRVVANVYAPFSGVSVNSGADFYGSVRGKTVTVDGDGLIAYDEALQDSEYASGGEGNGKGIIEYWR
ncbi:hypothetical protein IEI94_18935 [Halomonas sp. ML-15]|uniref:DUF7305 domain-containing protein n=1 Tax=Halomonas sp. ML-15 TaxID=2773305 RepID=UPI00174699B1|nr:PilX N-terminal domain-containing pilus assembly protein [Halomonas sp. ML-15]MBD3897937.1 hypothetical protein [Halomonas sp. ML-15]